MADTIITLTERQYNCLKDELQVYWRRFSKAAKVAGLTVSEQDTVDRALLALTLSLSAIRYGGKRWGLPATAVIVGLRMMLGNGAPLPMGRALVKAIRTALAERVVESLAS